jgi:hypothetical protein
MNRVFRVVLGCAMAMAGCESVNEFDVECGPLNALDCEKSIEEIRSALSPQIQGRRIASIELFSESEALVTLADGTPVGWNRDGRR